MGKWSCLFFTNLSLTIDIVVGILAPGVYRSVLFKAMPELMIVSASFKVGSWVLDSSALQSQHHYSVESWVRFGLVPSSAGCKKSLSCLSSSWSSWSLKGQCRTLAVPGWEGTGGSSWWLWGCCLCAQPVAIILWLKGRARASQGSCLRTECPNVLDSVRGYWTLATKTFGLLFCNTEHMTSMEFKSLRDVSFFMKLPAEEPIEKSI